MFINGLGTAVPPRRYSQRECWQAFQAAPQFNGLDRRARAILQRVLLDANGIGTRALALDSLAECFELDPDTLHRRFALHAPKLATEAARRALESAQLCADDIDAVIISTCTGYLCPGLTSYVGERLGLRPNVFGLDLVGQGCGAAVPNLRAGSALLKAGDASRVLSICVEVCSAAFYIDNDPGVLISACLFGDGAGAAVLANSPAASARRIEWTTAASLHDSDRRDTLRFEHANGMLRNILTPEVPHIAATHAAAVLADVLTQRQMTQRQIGTWVLHGGGRKVIEALRDELGLSADDLGWASAVLNEFGNVSSASVYFALQAALNGGAPGGWWWMSSFGAGFSCHGALLKVA
ncbi:MAG: Chalcone and stilbene synthase domain protein [Betaproteobacteria bacterium]|nr:Chalcone and stilbene synthase domain protein [Betaproteobacteria bacterium]